MKKTLCALLVMVVLLCSVIPVSTKAAEPRILSIVPGLSFDGTTAYCEVAVVGDYSTDRYTVVIKLWEGNSCIATWDVISTGYVDFSRTHTVKLNTKYTLTVDVTLNGETLDRVSISRTS